MNDPKLRSILDKFSILKKIPVIYDLDFGHTQSIFTVPLGQSHYKNKYYDEPMITLAHVNYKVTVMFCRNQSKKVRITNE
ncbi:hypothetical protein JOD28_000439 [Leuconostoc rapi]|nr:hypothetical protein [Leuconostoc rapi]